MNRVPRVVDRIRIRRALVSVSDKSQLDELVPALAEIEGIRILSTGGTYRRLAEMLGPAGADVLQPVSAYTGQPETQGGLVKTLDFKIYLGLLSEPFNEQHAEDRRRTGADLIDLVVVNLYPFRSVAAREDSDAEDARSNIDIGGPTMLRAAAKSYLRVAAVCDPSDYGGIVTELAENDGTLSLETRYRLAQKAFGHTAQYDRAISEYLADQAFASAASPYEIMPGEETES
jgi:phosphoribosylaminoimidazolecarboxamide formyltransferase/IMP cyclohydrolase